MFHSAAVKLTAWYLAIIMALSIGLSIALYNVSNRDLVYNLRRQNGYYNFLPPQDLRNLNAQRQGQISDSRQHLEARLVIFNLVVVVVGGAISYALARRTLEPIEESLDSQSRFAGDAAHELRTPLTAMQTEIEVTLRDPKLNKTQAVEQLESNLEEVAKLRALSDGLLALVSANPDAKYDSTVSLKRVAEAAIKNVDKTAALKSIKIDSQQADLQLKGNQAQLVNLVTILLDNAIKYSADKSAVRLSAERHDKNARISVTDHGIGIKQIDLKKIFDRFYRADNSRSKIKTDGYGLGLAIAKQIVERHHGYIEVRSQPDKGSSFIVNLPLAS